jgi:hypothetical protein
MAALSTLLPCNIEFSCPAASAQMLLGIAKLHSQFQAASQGTTATICYGAWIQLVSATLYWPINERVAMLLRYASIFRQERGFILA